MINHNNPENTDQNKSADHSCQTCLETCSTNAALDTPAEQYQSLSSLPGIHCVLDKENAEVLQQEETAAHPTLQVYGYHSISIQSKEKQMLVHPSDLTRSQRARLRCKLYCRERLDALDTVKYTFQTGSTRLKFLSVRALISSTFGIDKLCLRAWKAMRARTRV